jgi:hypothetical protein
MFSSIQSLLDFTLFRSINHLQGISMAYACRSSDESRSLGAAKGIPPAIGEKPLLFLVPPILKLSKMAIKHRVLSHG